MSKVQQQYRMFISMIAATLIFVGMVDSAEGALRDRGQARASVNRAPAAHAQRASRPDMNRNTQRAHQANAGNRVNSAHNNRVGNRTRVNNSQNNINIDNHRDVDIDVDGRGHWGYDDHYHPIATAAAVTATVAVTSAVVGAIIRPAQLPSSCVQVIRFDVTYMQCGSTWYQPQYQGSDITYVVVNAP
jgi:hypothetical protein